MVTVSEFRYGVRSAGRRDLYLAGRDHRHLEMGVENFSRVPTHSFNPVTRPNNPVKTVQFRRGIQGIFLEGKKNEIRE